jgi:hypothetical protein
MLVKFEDIQIYYEKIKEKYAKGTKKLAIFVAADCDAICALKILLTILQ